jgi:hypothetical protein
MSRGVATRDEKRYVQQSFCDRAGWLAGKIERGLYTENQRPGSDQIGIVS